ncbi:MAG TPA: hypothetical protein HPP87_04710 [Planctomycetes bacterium]|nr:hypothetical protein [Planctomycetota bacterium]
MAILNIRESWEDMGYEAGVESASAPRVFTVLFDNADDPFTRPEMAWNAATHNVRIPYIYERHPSKTWLWVQRKSVRALSPCLFEVSIHYSTRPAGPADESQIDPTVSPLQLPWQISWGFAGREEPIDRDINGDPIVNSADEAFDPPVTRPFYDLTLAIIRNQAEYNPLLAADYKDTLNSDYFYGFAPGIVKCADISADSARNADLFYWHVHYQFQMRRIGWALKLIDRGYREKVGVDGEGKPIYDAIMMGTSESGEADDDQKVPVNQPAYLDGSGRKKADSAAITVLEFDILESKDFSVLEL